MRAFFFLLFYFILHNLGWLDQILIFKRSGYIIETVMGNCAKEKAFCLHYLTWYRFSKHRVVFEEESTQEIVILFSWTIQLDKNWHFEIDKFITIFSVGVILCLLLLPVMSLHFFFLLYDHLCLIKTDISEMSHNIFAIFKLCPILYFHF